MQMRDIVNRGLVNLTNCDEEPIHIPGTIQPHGFLLALEQKGLTTEYCSGNASAHLGLRLDQLLGKPLSGILESAAYGSFQQNFVPPKDEKSISIALVLKGKPYDCTVHQSGAFWIAEFEPADTALSAETKVFDQTLNFVQYMQESQSLQRLCAKVAEEIRTITGYDRVMVYRFDKDYNGEVFAEAKREDIESFFGLHYPHTDIPAQARQLYVKNLLRIIPDVGYSPEPIYTLRTANHQSLDLGLSVLRSVSPIHVQYLQNMGVQGTLTISLLHEGKLWGLVACHHYSPKYLSRQTRLNAQLQGHFLTSQINVRQQAEEYQNAREINAALESLLNIPFEPNRESLAAMSKRPELLQICNAGGVAILLNDAVYAQGQVPPHEEVKALAAWSGSQSQQGLYSTHKLTEDYPDGDRIHNTASGLIFYALDAANTASILWFNPETVQEVQWAGDPEKAIVKDEAGLHPRKSFDKWKQVIRFQAREWMKAEMSAATAFAYALQKHISLLLLTEEEVHQRLLMEKLRETNEQLENINWISTHDLKEPLRKIQMQSSRLLLKERNLSTEVATGLEKMNRFAGTMQHMIADLSALGKLEIQHHELSPINLSDAVQNLLSEFADDLNEKGGRITVGELPVVKGIPVLVRQLFVNLIGNALKFVRPGVPPQVWVSASTTEKQVYGEVRLFHAVTVEDNGIGFDPAASDDIFKIFHRLHAKSDYSGSGIGLALCKKIMQKHNGTIEATAVPGKGAVFTLYFPA